MVYFWFLFAITFFLLCLIFIFFSTVLKKILFLNYPTIMTGRIKLSRQKKYVVIFFFFLINCELIRSIGTTFLVLCLKSFFSSSSPCCRLSPSNVRLTASVFVAVREREGGRSSFGNWFIPPKPNLACDVEVNRRCYKSAVQYNPCPAYGITKGTEGAGINSNFTLRMELSLG